MTGTGVTAKAPTYLNNCWITNWDVGALAADGGWIWVEKQLHPQRHGSAHRHHGELLLGQ